MGWLVVQSKPQQELYAESFCRYFGWSTYHPQYQDKDRIKSLFPRYFFVKERDGRWWSLTGTPGVTQVIRKGDGFPALMRDQVIDALRAHEDYKGLIKLPKRPWFSKHQILRTKDPWHVLAGHDLVFKSMAGKDRIRVMMQWLGREQLVTLDVAAVQVW